MTINWWTMALQTINFLVLVWLLQHFLYKPVLAVIAKRKQLVDQAFSEAETAKQAATAEQQKFQQGQAELVQARQDLLKDTHSELEKERIQITATARGEAAAMLDAARAQIDAERAAALEEVRKEVADLAVAMAGALLERLHTQTPPVELNEGFLAQMTGRLAQLPAEELNALRSDLETSAEGLRVMTAAPLPEDQRELWRHRLEDSLGTQQRLEFLVEPTLIGGAELRFPHAVMSFAWSDLLAQGKRTLLENDLIH